MPTSVSDIAGRVQEPKQAGSLCYDYPWPDSSLQQDLAEARRIIEECHYHRRLEELEDAEAVLLEDSSHQTG